MYLIPVCILLLKYFEKYHNCKLKDFWTLGIVGGWVKQYFRLECSLPWDDASDVLAKASPSTPSSEASSPSQASQGFPCFHELA